MVVSQQVLDIEVSNLFGIEANSGGISYPWNARYKNMKKIPNPFPTLLVVPAYSAVIAARHDVVTMIPTKPVMYMPRRELTLSWSQAPRGL